MNLKRWVVRSVVILSLGALLGGCCFIPFEHHRYAAYRGYSEGRLSHHEMDGDRR